MCWEFLVVQTRQDFALTPPWVTTLPLGKMLSPGCSPPPRCTAVTKFSWPFRPNTLVFSRAFKEDSWCHAVVCVCLCCLSSLRGSKFLPTEHAVNSAKGPKWLTHELFTNFETPWLREFLRKKKKKHTKVGQLG